MSAPEKHALLSASGAARWLACPPSARLEEQLPESTSSYAEEGRLAHAIVELTVRKHFVEPMGPKKFNAALKKLQEQPCYDSEMLRHANTFLDYVKSVSHRYNGIKPHVAVERMVDYSLFVPEGFGTSDCIMICGADLHVFDYKYGQGVPVSAEQNPQMMLYGIGALNAYVMLFQIQNIVMHIVQPRLDSTSEYRLTTAELLAWAESIRPIAQTAYEGRGEFRQGDHCRFCRAKAQCRARADQQLALESFKQIPPALLSASEVGEILQRAQNLAKWAKDVEDYALAQCLAGEEIPGWKAVEGRAVRVWTNMDDAFTAITKNGTEEALLYERTPLSLAKVEKLLGKKVFNEIAAEFITTPPGKPTLAPASDNRKPITRPTAEEIFAN